MVVVVVVVVVCVCVGGGGGIRPPNVKGTAESCDSSSGLINCVKVDGDFISLASSSSGRSDLSPT